MTKLKAEHQAALKAYVSKLPDMREMQNSRVDLDIVASDLDVTSRLWGYSKKDFISYLDERIAGVEQNIANPAPPDPKVRSRVPIDKMILEELKKIRGQAGSLSPQELLLKGPGEKTNELVYNASREVREREAALVKQIADLQDPAKRRRLVGNLEDTLKAARKALTRARVEAAQANREYCTEFGLEARKVLSEVRPMGAPDPKAAPVKRYNLKPGSKPNAAVVQHVDRMSTTVPSDWWAASNADKQTVRLLAEGNKRAHYRHSDGELLVPAFAQESSQSTALHEFAHRFETVLPRLDAVMIEFRNRRTQGERVQLLRDITGIRAYKTSEVTREDDFEHPYMGKDYGGRNSEILSMGLEALFHSKVQNSIMAIQDPEYRDLILGALAGL